MYYKRKNKMNNKKSKCQQNHYHQSQLEAQYCNLLQIFKNKKLIKDYTVQKKYELYVNNKHICNHYVDFEIINNEDKIEIHETKGFETELWKIKKRLFEAIYDYPYIVIKKIDKKWMN